MRKGFTLLEVMVAAAILAIGTLGVLGMQMSVVEYNRSVSMRLAAVSLAEEQLSILELQAINGCKSGSLCASLKNQMITQGNWGGFAMETGAVSGAGVLTTSNGILQNGNVGDNSFYVAYYNLAFGSTNPQKYSELCPGQECIRGAVRVTWARNARMADHCRDLFVFENLDRAINRGSNQMCEFLTMPFVFSTVNIYKT